MTVKRLNDGKFLVEDNGYTETLSIADIHYKIIEAYSEMCAITDDAPSLVNEMLESIIGISTYNLELLRKCAEVDSNFDTKFNLFCDGYKTAYMNAHPDKYPFYNKQ